MKSHLWWKIPSHAPSVLPIPSPRRETVTPVSAIMWFIYWSCTYKSKPPTTKNNLPQTFGDAKLKILASLTLIIWNKNINFKRTAWSWKEKSEKKRMCTISWEQHNDIADGYNISLHYAINKSVMLLNYFSLSLGSINTLFWTMTY